MDDESVEDEGIVDAGSKDLGDTNELLIEIIGCLGNASDASFCHETGDEVGVTIHSMMVMYSDSFEEREVLMALDT